MRLRLIAPATVDLALRPGCALRDPEGYSAFWQAAADLVGNVVPAASAVGAGTGPSSDTGARVVVEHVRSVSAFNRYQTIESDSLDRPLHLIEWTFPQTALTWSAGSSTSTEATGASLHLDVPVDGMTERERSAVVEVLEGLTEVGLRLHDHGIVLVEVAADLGGWAGRRDARPLGAEVDALQQAAVEVGEAAARAGHDHYVQPTVRRLRAQDDGAHIVLPSRAGGQTGPRLHELGQVLWVARSLVIGPRPDEATSAVVRHWIKDVPEETGEPSPDGVTTGALDHLTRWLNYVYVDDRGAGDPMAEGGRFADEWQALRYAQFFYGALDTADTGLARILADSLAARSRAQRRQLRDELRRLSQRAELILIQIDDVSKYLSRSVRSEMHEILRHWSFDQAIAQPLRQKVALCRERLDDLTKEQSERSRWAAGLVLLLIGLTQIFATAVAFVDFGRTTASDPDLSAYDVDRDGFVAWFASLPTNLIIRATFVVTVVLIAFYAYVYRRELDEG